MRRWMPVLLLAAAVGVGAGTPSYSADELFDTKAATEHLEKGLAAIRAKQYDNAIQQLEESVNINPTAETYYYLGYAYYLRGKITGDSESRKLSRENFDRAYELDPQYSPTGLGLPAPTAAPPQRTTPVQEQPAAITDDSATPDEAGERVFRGTYQTQPEAPAETPQQQPAPPAEPPPQPPQPPADQQPPPPPPLPPPQPAQ